MTHRLSMGDNRCDLVLNLLRWRFGRWNTPFTLYVAFGPVYLIWRKRL